MTLLIIGMWTFVIIFGAYNINELLWLKALEYKFDVDSLNKLMTKIRRGHPFYIVDFKSMTYSSQNFFTSYHRVDLTKPMILYDAKRNEITVFAEKFDDTGIYIFKVLKYNNTNIKNIKPDDLIKLLKHNNSNLGSHRLGSRVTLMNYYVYIVLPIFTIVAIAMTVLEGFKN